MPEDRGLTTRMSWESRYQSDRGLGVPGTFTHTHRGNIQFYRVKFKRLDSCLRRHGMTLEGKTVLDAAGGSGQFIDYYLKRGAARILVADFAESALEQVRSRYGNDRRIRTVRADLSSNIPPWAREYDFASVMEAIFLLPTDEALSAAIRNLGAALKVGGRLVISDVFPQETYRENAYVVRRSRNLFEELLAEQGFEKPVYFPQTFFFNRCLFGRAQGLLERFDPLLYWLDNLALAMGFRPPRETPADVKYLVAEKT